ncbi:MAG TPA: hypothetical protein VH501_07770 [Solirubrobacterales bacterium]|jgi:hypothetical protein
MKRTGSVVLCCLGVGAIGAGAALADSGKASPNSNRIAAQECTTELHAMGAKAFKGLYGDQPKGQHAMRNCQRKHGKSAGKVAGNAAQQCKAEQADPDFAAGHGGMTFDQVYGTNHNGKNSFGKCVSAKAQAMQAQREENLRNAAQQCRAERGDASFAGSHEGQSFNGFYGTNRNNRNAFGKCVSQKAKAQGATPTA